MLVIGVVLVTGTSIGSIFRGLGRGVRGVFVGGRGMAETVVRTREDRARAAASPRPGPAPTDVMSTYPEEDDFEPTVAIGSFDDDVAEAEAGHGPRIDRSRGPTRQIRCSAGGRRPSDNRGHQP